MAVPSVEQNNIKANENTIILAGATGELGRLIAGYLLQKGAVVKALVRKGSTNQEAARALKAKGAIIVEVDYNGVNALTQACAGGSCVVSALSGLREVIVDLQTRLLTAALNANVARFIPSDYCIDFTKQPAGLNRNLDLRREFMERLNQAPIAATSVLNGMFTDLLTGQAPVILFKFNRILFWGNANQLLDFTTMDDTAKFTAYAALDKETPRFLRVAGQVCNVYDLMNIATDVTGKKFRLFRAGSLGMLKTMAKVTKTLMPDTGEIFPPWQGMQYLHDMFTGLPKLNPLDNNRYPEIRWTLVKEVLENRPVS